MYCPNCGGEVSEEAKYCPDCGTEQDEEVSASRESSPQMSRHKKSYWWIAVLSPVLLLTGYFGLSFALGFMTGLGMISSLAADLTVDVFSQFLFLGLLLSAVLVPVGVYQERTDDNGWTPHIVYYTGVVPGLNILIALIYVIHRHYDT